MVCPICSTICVLFDVVDLNKSCEEQRGKYLSLSGIPIYYALCDRCGFCWAQEMYSWPLTTFEELIYNDDYIAVDPDYLEDRPKANLDLLRSMFQSMPSTVRHLDYGGGNGLLTKLLRELNWNSVSYDPLVNKNVDLKQLGKFDLITAFEVFEHVPDVLNLMSDICFLLSNDGLVLFSTLLSDGNIYKNQRLSWWYASPRNGHISLFSRKSLYLITQNNGFNIGSFSNGLHIIFKTIPLWANHLIRTRLPINPNML